MRGDVLFGLQTSSQGMEIFAQLLLPEVIAHFLNVLLPIRRMISSIYQRWLRDDQQEGRR